MHSPRNSARAPESEEGYRTLLEINNAIITGETRWTCFRRIFWDWPQTRSPILRDFGSQLKLSDYSFPQANPPLPDKFRLSGPISWAV
jgi:hypothetical protein